MAILSGLHLFLDGLSRWDLEAETLGYFLYQCPRVIQMAVIVPGVVYKTADGGLCGFTVIAESHISVHCQGRQVWVDIFSCRNFDVRQAVDFAEDALALSQLKYRVIERTSALALNGTQA